MSGSWTAVITKILYKKKLIVRCGYELLNFLEKQKKPFWKRVIIYFIEKIVYKKANKIILSSNKDKRFVIKKFKINANKIKLIPNYIDIESFKPLNISKDKDREILFIGRLEKQKNIFNLIKALKGLSIKLVLIGSGSLKKELESFAKRINVKVEFKGNIPNNQLPRELNKFKIFALPSFYEGCPKSLLEAMSCGLSCIGADVQGINEIIKHKENGYLCGTSAESIKNAITDLLTDKSLQRKISYNARKTILEVFSLEKVLYKEIKIYESL